MSDEKSHPMQFCCKGDALGRDGKLIQRWSLMVEGKPELTWHSWTKPVKGAVPGAVYTFHLTKPNPGEPGAARMMGGDKAPKFERMYHMQDVVAAYQVEHKATHMAKDAIAREAKEKRQDALKERLHPITMAYLRADTRQRAAILVTVLRYIMGGG